MVPFSFRCDQRLRPIPLAGRSRRLSVADSLEAYHEAETVPSVLSTVGLSYLPGADLLQEGVSVPVGEVVFKDPAVVENQEGKGVSVGQEDGRRIVSRLRGAGGAGDEDGSDGVLSRVP